MEQSGRIVRIELEALKKLIGQQLSKLEKRHPTLSGADESERNALWMKQIAASLMKVENADRMQGLTSITLYNIYTDMQETVSLNPKLSLPENAALYEKKSAKLRLKSENAKQDLMPVIERHQKLSGFLQQLSALSPENLASDEGTELLHTVRSAISQDSTAGSNATDTVNRSTPYRYFESNGWEIYAGKTDEQNDELSTRFTRQRDLWFHAAHCPGSHVVLKCPGDAARPPQEIIEHAATVAAWFSKSRNAPSAEVHMTEGRFVHKRKNAPKGEVMLEKFTTIKVCPRNPDELFRK